ncbi:HD domain-containing phosphohydrolase [Methylobacter psychrophilus]|uniref:HD domain-containing phosphohydrolase n=1 Tax=Methylobacter psychrophilus TaxID=96941 RepID=UPI0021D51B92|nr:HD domain-containing phosphohydrolase [Methylobacter psychrophilus]
MTKLLRILHLEDSPADAELIRHLLRKAGLDVTLLRVETRDQFVAQLEEFKPDLILADYHLPEFDGLQALAIARQKVPLIPFIFVTGIMGEDIAIETLKKGASDYIIKDRLARLPTAIKQALEKQQQLTKRVQVKHDLLVSEIKFRTLFESSADAILVQNDYGFIDCNPAALTLFGCTTRADLFDQYPILSYMRSPSAGEESLSLLNQHIATALKKGSHRFEWTCYRLDGEIFFIDVSIVNMKWENKNVLMLTIHNITQFKIQQAKIQRLTNIYATLSECNEAIVRTTNETDLFQIICRAVVEHGGMKSAWIGLVDEATRHIIPVASYGVATELIQNTMISLDTDNPANYDPIGASVRENQTFWCQDLQQDTTTGLWHNYGKRYQWGSLAAIPLHKKDNLVGVFTLFAQEANAFDSEARKLLNEMAANINYALDNLAHESERKLNESILKDSEARFRILVEQSIAGVYIIQEGKLIYVNPRFAEILGYPKSDELLGHDPLEIISTKDRRLVEHHLLKLKEGVAKAESYICSVMHKDGRVVDVGMNTSTASYQGSTAIIGLMQDISDKKVAEEQIKHYATQLQIVFMQTVGLITTLSEIRDPYTAGHERRVANIAGAIGIELGLDALQVEGLKVGGYLHDVGKTSVPIEILIKPGKISALEYEIIKLHPMAGYNVLKDVDFPWPVAQIALQHHERMDGSGYPQGLKGDDILLEARIMAIADVVEAMSSHRPYRPGIGIDAALAEIERGRGALYDPVIADICLNLFHNKGYIIPD